MSGSHQSLEQTSYDHHNSIIRSSARGTAARCLGAVSTKSGLWTPLELIWCFGPAEAMFRKAYRGRLAG